MTNQQKIKRPRKQIRKPGLETTDKSNNIKLSAPAPNAIRIVPLGGTEEIGKNMTVVEFGDDIVVVDAGLAFPGEETPGIDYIIPDTTYLEERRDKVRALIVTHGHMDHIGAIPYVMPKIGNPIIYTTLLTAIMIKKRQEEFSHLPKLNIRVLATNEPIKIGSLVVRFFAATHTIPDSAGVVISTPYGNIIFTGDIKLNHKAGVPAPEEVKTFGELAKEKTLVLLADSTNIESPGFSKPEHEAARGIEEILRAIKGRMIICAFASQLERLIRIIMVAEELGKKVVIEGRTLKTNIEIAKELGLLKIKRGTIITSSQIETYPPEQILVLATGAQGNEFSALVRMAQKEHREIKIRKGDTIMFSSSVVPGNERAVEKVKDNLSRQGAKIIHYGIANVHATGHSYQGEIEWVHKQLKPKFFIPIHGNHYRLRVHADLAMRLGLPEKNIVVPDNGMIIEITDSGKKIAPLKHFLPAKLVMVDGLGAGDVKEVVIRDRQLLAQDGILVIIAIIDIRNGRVRRSPDIASRGFIYLKESQELLRHIRLLVKKKIEEAVAQMHPINLDYVKNMVREEVGKYLFQKTGKRPIILPILIEV